MPEQIPYILRLVAPLLLGVFLIGCREKGAENSSNGESSSQTSSSIIPGDKQAEEVKGERLPSSIATKFSDSVLTLEVLNSKGETISTGTCFVAVKPTWLWTNAHVLKKDAKLRARTKTGAYFDVQRLLKVDAERDIAVMEISATGMTPCPVAENLPEQGAKCATIGCPLGLDLLVTEGVVSSVFDDGPTKIVSFSAPISPGSSGSPLFSASGEVLGICTKSASEGQNLNLAVASSEMNAIAEAVGEAERQAEALRNDPVALFEKLRTEKLEGQKSVQKLPVLDEFLENHPSNESAIIEKAKCLKDLGMYKQQREFLVTKIAEGVETPKVYQLLSSCLWWISRKEEVSVNGLDIDAAEKALALAPEDPENWVFLAGAHRLAGRDSEATSTLHRAIRVLAPADGEPAIGDLLTKGKLLNELARTHSLGRTKRKETAEKRAELDEIEIEYLRDELECYSHATSLGHEFEPGDARFKARWWLGMRLWGNHRDEEAIAVCEANTADVLAKDVPEAKRVGEIGPTNIQMLLNATEDLALWKVAHDQDLDIGSEVDAILKLATAGNPHDEWDPPICLAIPWISVAMIANQDWKRVRLLIDYDEENFLEQFASRRGWDATDESVIDLAKRRRKDVAFHKALYHLGVGELELYENELAKVEKWDKGLVIKAKSLDSAAARKKYLIEVALIQWNADELKRR